MPCLHTGRRVKIVGLTVSVHLNDQDGLLGSLDERTGRWPVHLRSGKAVLVRSVNLEILYDGATHQGDASSDESVAESPATTTASNPMLAAFERHLRQTAEKAATRRNIERKAIPLLQRADERLEQHLDCELQRDWDWKSCPTPLWQATSWTASEMTDTISSLTLRTVCGLELPSAVLGRILHLLGCATVDLSLLDAIFRSPGKEQARVMDVCQKLLAIVQEAWYTKSVRSSDADPGNIACLSQARQFAAMMSMGRKDDLSVRRMDDRGRGLPPFEFVIQGSQSRSTALREGSDVDIAFLFISECFEEEVACRDMLESVRDWHCGLSLALRSVEAHRAGVRFLQYIRGASDRDGNGLRVSFCGFEVDCVVGCREWAREGVLAALKQWSLGAGLQKAKQGKRAKRLKEAYFSKLKVLFPLINIAGHSTGPMTETRAAAIRLLKLWRKLVQVQILDGELLNRQAGDRWEMVDPHMRFGRGGPPACAKDPKGYVTCELEWLIAECAAEVETETVDDLLEAAWRKLSSGWLPEDSLDGLEMPGDTLRILLRMREQLAAKVTLNFFNGDAVHTLLCLSHLKAIDYIAAERSIAFDSGNNPMFLFETRSEHLRFRPLGDAVRFFLICPLLRSPRRLQAAEQALNRVRMIVSFSTRPKTIDDLRRKTMPGMCARPARELCDFNTLAVGYWWLSCLELEPLEDTNRSWHPYQGQSPMCLFDYEDVRSISGDKRGESSSDSERWWSD